MIGASAFLAVFLSSATLQSPAEPHSVIGGEPSPSCAWPTTVSLGGCTGTLVHPEVVVYAAHCGPEIPAVWFGEQAFSGDGRQVATSECHVNPGYLDGNGERHEDWAFCRLAEPVTDVPIVPPLMGCETTLLTPGRPVTIVGFGLDEKDNNGIKREGETELQWITEDGAVLAGNGEVGSCFGDSGGPIYLQLPDGSWRVFGIVSGGQACGFPAWYATVHTAVPTIEATLGIDITPCHYAGGGWNPSPACGGVPTEPWNGAGTSWQAGCGGGPVLETVSTCGDASDGTDDLVGPQTAVVTPAWGDEFASEEDSGFARVEIVVEASDVPSGVRSVALSINGEVFADDPDLDPPWAWGSVTFPPGVWEISAVATDWAGNISEAPVVMIGVDETPPAMPEPEPEGSTGLGGGTGGESTGAAVGGSATSEPEPEPEPQPGTDSSGSSSGAQGAGVAEDSGCGCTADASGGFSGWLWLLVLGAVRRRRVSWALGATLAATGCTDDAQPETGESSGGASSSTSSNTSSEDTSTSRSGSSSTTAADETSTGLPAGSTGGASSSGDTTVACEVGSQGCGCDEGFTCRTDLRCELDTCVACPAGSAACHCVSPEVEGDDATCENELLCVNDLCASPPPCPFTNNGSCDEGIGTCFEGSDVFDCCASHGDGVCEEEAAGGDCPEGSDVFDCCPTIEDGTCEEASAGGSCPEGSDVFDCCAVEPGVCEEMSAGGKCPEGSDLDDCAGDPPKR
ncbi:MAG: trypsin-like serine protease [Nannocystaceae bacterium]|nr:trypsin-like serine protease [Nannocystaceae bacterium]